MRFSFYSLLVGLLFQLLASVSSLAQNTAPGQWLVQLKPGVDAAKFSERLAEKFGNGSKGLKLEIGALQSPAFTQIAPGFDTWLVHDESCNTKLLEWLVQQPEVLAAQANHYLLLRDNLLPNDPLFNQQWPLLNDGSAGGLPNADIDAELAWDFGTGGLTMAGDTIVVAVIDAGVNRMHPDLSANLWVNYAETADDGLDNDGNGCIDDFYGWNIFSQNDDIQGISAAHGTPVCGITGAVGNNGIGIAGVNWNVKMMFIAGGSLESEVLAAYDYVLRARRKYNESNGAKGAFVVAVNCSWGLDYGQPDDAPVWCGAFDVLGQAGILSVAATANNPENVDEVGDLPTTCPSNYLISVTSLDKFDQKAPDAAWGAFNIDLGAYGQGVLSTKSNGHYDYNSGTSFAAPQVTGAIALLYASACPELIGVSKVNPQAGALWAKNILLNSVTPNLSLQGKTLTGGRLNVFQAIEKYQVQCASCPAPFALNASVVGPYAAKVHCSAVPGIQSLSMRWRVKGAATWTVEENVALPVYLEGLSACTEYEFSLRNRCLNGEWSEWSAPATFLTLGCCEAPTFGYQVSAEAGATRLLWDNLYGFAVYKVLLRPEDSSNWTAMFTSDTTFLLQDLPACTAYEAAIEGWCLNAWTPLTPVIKFTSVGCGACLETAYCPILVNASQEEWIAAVQMGNWLHESGWGGGGYQDFTGLPAVAQLQVPPNSSMDVVITPGFWGAPYKEYFRIFIDFNQDGDFDDDGELAFDPGFALEGAAIGSLVSPAFSGTGNTRMRVVMKYIENNQLPPIACDAFDFGQVEDYCVALVSPQSDAFSSPDSSMLLKIYPQPATEWVQIDVPENKNQEYELKIWDLSGRQMSSQFLHPLRNKTAFIDTKNWQPGVYMIALKSGGKVYRGKLLKH